MSIHGPYPPSSSYHNYPAGSHQLSQLALATYASQLAHLTPLSKATNALNDAQKNTNLFFRLYADLLMISFIESHPSSYPPNYVQNYLNDLQTIAKLAPPSFDPKLMSDIQFYYANPNYLDPSNPTHQPTNPVEDLMANFNAIIAGVPRQGYNPDPRIYDFTNLNPDDMYNFYLIQLGTCLVEGTSQFPGAQAFWGTDQSSSLLGMEFGRFICTYFVQRDGMNTPELAKDIANFRTLIRPIMDQIADYADQYPGINGALYNSIDHGYAFDGVDESLRHLEEGKWEYGDLPGGSNNCLPPWWDVTPPPTTSWTFNPDFTFLMENDSNLSFYLESLRGK